MDASSHTAAKIVKLNIGGTLFSTTLVTLCADQNSMLASMFSGRYALDRDESGHIFIDRNGEWFSLILDWLRTKAVSPHLTPHQQFHLRKEAEFFQISGLIAELDTMKEEAARASAPSEADREYTLQVWTLEKPEDCADAVSTMCKDGYLLENFQYVKRKNQSHPSGVALKFVGFFSKKKDPQPISTSPAIA